MKTANPKKTAHGRRSRLAAVDMRKKLKEQAYQEKLAVLHDELRRIQQAYIFSGDPAAIVFEGWDAAGKGGGRHVA